MEQPAGESHRIRGGAHVEDAHQLLHRLARHLAASRRDEGQRGGVLGVPRGEDDRQRSAQRVPHHERGRLHHLRGRTRAGPRAAPRARAAPIAARARSRSPAGRRRRRRRSRGRADGGRGPIRWRCHPGRAPAAPGGRRPSRRRGRHGPSVLRRGGDPTPPRRRRAAGARTPGASRGGPRSETKHHDAVRQADHQGPRAAMAAPTQGSGSTASPRRRTSKYRYAPLSEPVSPTVPTTSPGKTWVPGGRSTSARWA